jgi:hypothetical protein
LSKQTSVSPDWFQLNTSPNNTPVSYVRVIDHIIDHDAGVNNHITDESAIIVILPHDETSSVGTTFGGLV